MTNPDTPVLRVQGQWILTNRLNTHKVDLTIPWKPFQLVGVIVFSLVMSWAQGRAESSGK